MASDLSSDPVRLAIAVCPLAAYLLLIGSINLQRFPFLTSGGRDALALGIGLSGLMFIGPLALMMPSWSLETYGGYAWLMMLVLYFLMLAFLILTRRPRLVIYNSNIQKLRPVLREAADSLDSSARWSGEALYLPTLQVHLILEEDYGTRNVLIKSVGPQQDYESWGKLESAMAQSMPGHEKQSPNPYGIFLVGLGAMLLVSVCYQVFAHGKFFEAFAREFFF